MTKEFAEQVEDITRMKSMGTSMTQELAELMEEDITRTKSMGTSMTKELVELIEDCSPQEKKGLLGRILTQVSLGDLIIDEHPDLDDLDDPPPEVSAKAVQMKTSACTSTTGLVVPYVKPKRRGVLDRF